MPTTFANTIDGNEILAKRSQCDYAGQDIQTTYATKTEVTTGLSGKQDTISDLAAIRSGAAEGATAVQPSDLSAVAVSGDYDDLSNKPTIPSGTQLVPAATSADADKVLTVNAQGTPAWATPAGGSVTDVEVNGSSVVNASGVAEVTVPAQVQSDWNATSGLGEILNKPTIPAAQVNSDWNASSGVAEILNKPTILPYKPVVAGTGINIVNDTANNRIVVEADDTALATQAELTTGLAAKQDTLTAGQNITITNNVISATGGGSSLTPFYATYGSTDYDDIWSAWNAGRLVYVRASTPGDPCYFPLTMIDTENDVATFGGFVLTGTMYYFINDQGSWSQGTR